jgi:hypothetical protein
MGKQCIGKVSGEVIINDVPVAKFEGIKAPFTVKRTNLKSWQVNVYSSYRPDNNCQRQQWDSFLLNDSNPESAWFFDKQYDVNDCSVKTATYRARNQFGGDAGNIFYAIIPAGFSFVPWKCRVEIIDADNNQIFAKDYPYGQCPKVKVKCAECPAGKHQVKINRYPGYCCLDCQSLDNQIRKIVRKYG